MKFGWCSPDRSKSSHEACKFQFIPTMGVHEGHLFVCTCECHEGREPDFSGTPEGTVLATEDNKKLKGSND